MPGFDASSLSGIPTGAFSGTAYRNQSSGFDPISGEGARRHGGRFNPPRSFPVIYLCASKPCVVAELNHQAKRQNLAVSDLLPRELWAIALDLNSVLDLGDAAIRDQLHLSVADLTREDHAFTQEIGECAHDLRYQAIRSPSATDVDEIIAVFPENLAGSTLEPRLLQTWTAEKDLPH